MNVLFWSFVPGMSRVSGSMLAVSLTTAIKHKIKCSISQLHYRGNGLIDAVIKDNVDDIDFSNTGVDALLRGASTSALSEEDVKNSAFSFVGGKFNVFSATGLHDEHIYINNLTAGVENMFTVMANSFKVNFIDIPSGLNAISGTVLNYADMIVVCLPQNTRVINQFFSNVTIDKSKLFIILGDYDPKQSLSLSNVMWAHHTQVDFSSGGTVPHCSGFANAMNQSRTISFFLHNQDLKPADSNYAFIKAVNVTTKKLLKKCKLVKG